MNCFISLCQICINPPGFYLTMFQCFNLIINALVGLLKILSEARCVMKRMFAFNIYRIMTKLKTTKLSSARQLDSSRFLLVCSPTTCNPVPLKHSRKKEQTRKLFFLILKYIQQQTSSIFSLITV